MKKVTGYMLGMLMGVSLLAGCGGKTDSADAPAQGGTNASANGGEIIGTITFLTNRTDMVGEVYDDYAKRFKEKYPNAEVQFEAITDLDKTTKIRMSSGDYPDVVLIPTIPNSDLPKYFAPLDDLGLADSIYFKEFKSYEDKLYGISVGATTTGIIYNKQAFKDAGITEVPRTLDEFYAASKKLKDKGIVPLASNFKDQWPLYPWSSEVPTAIANDAQLNNKRSETDTPYTMDNAYGQAMSIIREMNQQGYLEPDINSTNWEQSKKDIATGKFAMAMLGNWAIPQVIDSGTESDNIGFFPLPYDNSGKTNVTLAPDWAYGVNKNSENIATAKAFVKWMLEDSGFDEYAGFIPVLKDKKPAVDQLNEFNSYEPVYIEAAADDPKTTDIVNKAQITKEALVQEFVLASNPQSVLDKYNKAWAKARKDVMK
ncbi:ABC transporter substrate-binding protein [Saccharibacillus sp. JS10]|uniref:ABC transporter substrate-binding protein n=1 Tax=Saccharibacillus sp. JS10 TaxID=2950552 RepID=UPI00210CEEDD|nr:extracellular solute-binding protein [Saccharibacillus sp. JS10]MCQ4086361.1 extracellular solute-binding protein [Saccharibacillus sp. JS10]